MHASMRRGGTAGFLGVGVAAALATASLAYLFDPVSGNRRRALMRDKLHRAQRESREFIDKAGRDASQRAQGLYREAANRFQRRSVDDDKLEHRVRAELGRLTSHPRAIEVACVDGTACLRGDILESEADGVVRGVMRVLGVTAIDDQLQRHASAEHISSLQGEGRRRPLQRIEYLQSNWSPAPRVLAGAAAVGMILGAFGRRSSAAYALAAGGAALLARSISNVPLKDLMGFGATDQSELLVQKTFDVYADADEVYSCWRAVEQWPQFMTHVREIQRIDDTHYHWVVDGPAGIPVEWDSEITHDVPNERIAWRTVEGSMVHSSGVVRFEPSEYGGTRVHIRMGYHPPASAFGHTIARIFGRDPKHQIDDDVMRFKTFIQTRARPRDAAQSEIGQQSRAQQEMGQQELRH